ncbi:hypothetical protein RHGRI_001618 [Rhododendron griersonianum]|uniref:Uncharacterized protein n=1 Tax=Rhododendron griersonianum TaxID=479676 RepID=A0AAV6LM37_9ERIC|nr:hypothetical protein RHGRI_001618 [Rhododendron griersonianum]
MAQLSGLDNAFESMSVREVSISPTLERISIDHIFGKIVRECSYPSSSSSSPKFLIGVDEDSVVNNNWDQYASTHSTSLTSNWEIKHLNPPSDRVLVVMDYPHVRTFFHHHRSLTKSRYYAASVMESPHLSLLDSLLSSSLRPPFYRSSSGPLPTAHIHAFLDHLPTIKMWLKQNTAAHGSNQDLHYYELMHHKLSKLHDKVLALEDYSFELPVMANKYLRKKHNKLSKKFPTKQANFKRRAQQMVLQFRPLLAKTIQLEKEANTRKMEHEFLSYAWERFHDLVTWSFPHYFNIVSTMTEASNAPSA